MKLSDYVVEFLAEQGIRHVFLISGGAIIHCVDSVARNPRMKVICTQHEQGAGAAADGYARISGNLGAAMVTSGPGATNLCTSICNAYFDSIPVIFICGQVATFRIKRSGRLRQKGFQETDVTAIFSPVTKYAKQIHEARDIKYELEKAVYLAREGRPGPVLLDIPDDLQRVDIDPKSLRSFEPPIIPAITPPQEKLEKFFNLLCAAKRPVLILGAGVRIAGVREQALRFAEAFHLPILLTWGGMDLLERTHPLHMGGLGVCGPRAGNFAVQTADLVIAMGTRLSQMITGGKQSLFAPRARKVMIDIDAEELTKFTENDFQLDLAIQSHLPEFFKQFNVFYSEAQPDSLTAWRTQIKDWERRYPVCAQENYSRTEKTDGLVFIKGLSKAAPEGSIVIVDTGANLAWTMQAFDVKKNQRIISAWNNTPMGFSLPASAGAALAAGREVICISGDGGIMMSLEELGTIRRYNLPVKIFVMLNRGHAIQRQTIDTWLDSRYTAVDEESGLYFPDFVKVGEAFHLPAVVIENNAQIEHKLAAVFKTPGPVLVIVELVKDQRIVPMLKFGAGLEDLSPNLPPEEIRQILRVSENQNQSLPSPAHDLVGQ